MVMTHDPTANNGSRYFNRRLEELCPIPKSKSTYNVRIYHYTLSKNIYDINIVQYIFKN